MAHNAQYGTAWTVAAESPRAPGAMAACEIDLTYDSLADQVLKIGGNHFAHKFMAGYAGESVIATLQFQIGVADARLKQSNEREACGAVRRCGLSYIDRAGLEVD
jgi:hypothetical protein